jgi:DNA-binding NtrC family response regulator
MKSEAEQSPVRSALVVDDGAVERLAGKAMLEKLGFSVMTAASGEEALQLLDQQRAEIVLCDISMPGMGGLSLLEATREHPFPPLFIMSTSHNDAEHAVASLRSGAYGYLTKPLRFDVLRDTVSDALKRYQTQQHALEHANDNAHRDA